MIIGLIVALPSLSNNKFLSYFNIGYVEIVRAIPLLVLILWIYYGLPIMLGISFSPFVSGIIALTISESAFQAEIFRAGINSIPKGQHEISESLGMNFWKKMRFVILPQAIKVVLPAPLGPRRPNISPCCTFKVKFSIAVTGIDPFFYKFYLNF